MWGATVYSLSSIPVPDPETMIPISLPVQPRLRATPFRWRWTRGRRRGGRRRGGSSPSGWTVWTVGLLLLVSGGGGEWGLLGVETVSAQVPADTVAPPAPPQDPADTYRDPQVARLIRRAREARQGDLGDIQHYEARLRQRAYVGFRGVGFRRERGVFEEERAAWIRWERGGERTVVWTGARRDVPLLAGFEGASEDMAEELSRDLLRTSDAGPLLSDPWDDRLTLAGTGNWALHPLADTAGLHYRYASGDTLRIGLPDRRTVTLYEARVEPREVRFDLLAGSLWFDSAQGGLVRATYRPARPFDLDLDEPGEAADVPGILKPIRAEIRYITVDYSFHEFRWWLPRRWAFEGEAQVGRLARFPITLEWLLEDYDVNAELSSLPGQGELPAGWSRSQNVVRRDGEAPRYVTVIVPPGDSLMGSDALQERPSGREPTAFTPEELQELQGALEGLLPRGLRPPPTFGWGFDEGMVRYNRIEGLSVGARGVVPVTPRSRVVGEVRLGSADLEANVELGWVRGVAEGREIAFLGYRRLVASSEWNNAHSLGASLGTFLWGGDRAPFHRTLGLELSTRREGRNVRFEGRLFGERHSGVERGTHFHLTRWLTENDMVPALPVEEGDAAGVELLARWQRGLDPRGLLASGTVRGEAATGGLSWQRMAASLALVHPLPFRTAGAIEVMGGAGWGDLPPQRRFFVGGPGTVRGFQEGSLTGESFWAVRTEIAGDVPALRLALFGDLGWAGPRDGLRDGVPVASAGVGLSMLDGVFRADLARVLRGGSQMRLHLYLDGLF